jgi:hypothetical protein
MSTESAKEDSVFEWHQNSLKFVLTDLLRNWLRWLFWAGIIVVAGELQYVLFPLNGAGPKGTPPSPEGFLPLLLVIAFVTQFAAGLGLWRVRIHNGSIQLGEGRNGRDYQLQNIAHARFRPGDGSILFGFKSGRQLEIFLDDTVQAEQLKAFFRSFQITVDDR